MITLRILRWTIVLDYTGEPKITEMGGGERETSDSTIALKIEEEATSQRM